MIIVPFIWRSAYNVQVGDLICFIGSEDYIGGFYGNS